MSQSAASFSASLFASFAVHAGGDSLLGPLFHPSGNRAAQLAKLILVDELLAGRAHDGQSGGGQGQDQVRARRIVVVGGIGAAEGVAQNQQDAGRAHIDDGIEHGAAGLNDAAGFLLAPRQKSGGVLHEDDRDVVDIAEADKARNLQ